jgi:hypothetical protein
MHCPPGSYPEQWNIELKERVREVLGARTVPIDAWMQEDAASSRKSSRNAGRPADGDGRAKGREDAVNLAQVEKSILLERSTIYWKEHLATLDALRQVVFLRAYAQKTPINEYKQEAFGLFERMLMDENGFLTTRIPGIREDVTECPEHGEGGGSSHIPTEQAALFHRPRRAPPGSGVGAKPPEAAIIFGVADHHQRCLRACIGVGDQPVHQQLAEAFALPTGQHRHRADHDERRLRAVIAVQGYGPALEETCEYSGIVRERIAQLRQPAHPGADGIGSAAMPVRAERGIQQRVDRVVSLAVEGGKGRHSCCSGCKRA